MMVAVVAARMMQVSGDQIVSVVSMWDGFVSAARTMLVRLLMAAASVLRSAFCFIG